MPALAEELSHRRDLSACPSTNLQSLLSNHLISALTPILQRLFDLCQKPICGGTIENAMIEHKREIHHRADRNRIINDNDTLLHGTNAQDSALGLIDNGESKK